MNKTKQFWALLKFQPSINPFIVFLSLIVAMPFFLTHFTAIGNDYHPSLDLVLLGNQNLFFVCFIGVMWLAPELLQFRTPNSVWSNGTEFLLTRAVDRSLLLRARSTFFYLLILAVPLIALLAALRQPVLQISEYQQIAHQQILETIPGSVAAPPDQRGKTNEITLPNGSVLIESWHLWSLLVTAIATQVLIFAIYSLRFRRLIFWTVYLGVIFLPIFPLLNLNHAVLSEKLSLKEILFLSFVAHQLLFWILALLALVLGQFWCERRFARFEQ